MKDKRKVWIGVISTVLAILIFAAILCVQMAGQEEITYVTVVSAKTRIAENTVLTAAALETYLELKQVPEEYVPEDAYACLEELEGMAAAQISAGSILTEAMVKPVSDLYEDYRELFWVSISAEQLSLAVAGTLRAGDRIDLYCIEGNGEGSVCTLLQENVRIESALTKNGEEISNSDETSLTQLFVIPLERAEVAAFYEALSRGSLLIAKRDA